MKTMRRFSAMVGALLVLGYSSLPALAAICPPPAPPHACCLKQATNESKERGVKQPPCCRPTPLSEAVKLDPAAPAPSNHASIALPAAVVLRVSGERLALSVPACVQSPSPPPLAPPLRLRI